MSEKEDILSTSDIKIKCWKCGNEYPDSKGCPKCGEKGGDVIFDSGDCTNCMDFSTNSLCYPSGKCTRYNFSTGIGCYCDDFEATGWYLKERGEK